MADLILVADWPSGQLWACVDPASRFAEPAVAHGRLSACLHPFDTRPAAEAALRAAGGSDVREWKREGSAARPARARAPKKRRAAK
jgi:hypothetical protein